MSISSSILKTLAYADIFDYPLTGREVFNYLISDTEVTDEVVRDQLMILTDCKRIFADKGFFFLKGRNKIVDFRKKREARSGQKWEIARKTAKKLKIIPTVKMIGVTGALAMNNCKENDDIDLLIITARNTLWLTRLLLILSASFLGINRRKPNDTNVNNKICFNLFLDEDHLKIEPENLFLAHEIAQVKVIYDKGGIYEKFMQENRWIKKYLPNSVSINSLTIQQFNNRSFIAKLLNCFIAVLNKVTFWLQYRYMKPKMTIEKVSLNRAFFHPKDLSDKILREFERRILKF